MFWTTGKDGDHKARWLGRGGGLLIAALALAVPAAANDGGDKLLRDAETAGAQCEPRVLLVKRLAIVFDQHPLRSKALEQGGKFEVFQDHPGGSCAIVVSSDRGKSCLISMGGEQCSALNIWKDSQ